MSRVGRIQEMRVDLSSKGMRQLKIEVRMSSFFQLTDLTAQLPRIIVNSSLLQYILLSKCIEICEGNEWGWNYVFFYALLMEHSSGSCPEELPCIEVSLNAKTSASFIMHLFTLDSGTCPKIGRGNLRSLLSHYWRLLVNRSAKSWLVPVSVET